MRRPPMTETCEGCEAPAHFERPAARVLIPCPHGGKTPFVDGVRPRQCLCVRCYNLADRGLDWRPIFKPTTREPGGLFAETATNQGSLI